MRNEAVDEIVRSERLASLKLENARKEAIEIVKTTTKSENARLKNARIKIKEKWLLDTQKINSELEKKLKTKTQEYEDKLQSSREKYEEKFDVVASYFIGEVIDT